MPRPRVGGQRWTLVPIRNLPRHKQSGDPGGLFSVRTVSLHRKSALAVSVVKMSRFHERSRHRRERNDSEFLKPVIYPEERRIHSSSKQDEQGGYQHVFPGPSLITIPELVMGKSG